MGIPDNLVVHNLIPGTGSYFYTDKRIQLKNTSTAKLRRRQAVGQSPLQTHQTATQRAPMIMGGLRHHQLVVERDSGPLERLAGCI